MEVSTPNQKRFDYDLLTASLANLESPTESVAMSTPPKQITGWNRNEYLQEVSALVIPPLPLIAMCTLNGMWKGKELRTFHIRWAWSLLRSKGVYVLQRLRQLHLQQRGKRRRAAPPTRRCGFSPRVQSHLWRNMSNGLPPLCINVVFRWVMCRKLPLRIAITPIHVCNPFGVLCKRLLKIHRKILKTLQMIWMLFAMLLVTLSTNTCLSSCRLYLRPLWICRGMLTRGLALLRDNKEISRNSLLSVSIFATI